MTHRGLRRFLMLATFLLDETGSFTGWEWLDLYNRNMLANRLAARVGVRFPRTYSARDRARVRLSLSRWRPTELDTEFPEQRLFIRRAKTWSKP